MNDTLDFHTQPSSWVERLINWILTHSFPALQDGLGHLLAQRRLGEVEMDCAAHNKNYVEVALWTLPPAADTR